MHEKYYPLSEINAFSSYIPQIYSGKSTILLKTESYSVKQYITDVNGICINDSNYKKDCSIGDEKYICTNKRKACNIIITTCDPTAENPNSICSGYYLVEDEGEENNNTLYYCYQESYNTTKCDVLPSSTRGYFKVTDKNEILNYQFVKCDGGKCEKLLSNDLSDECKQDGDLIYKNKKYNLCYSNGFIRVFDNTKNEILKFDHSENIFTDITDENVVIHITYNYVIPADLSNLPTNIYLISDSVVSFLNKGNGKYSINFLSITGPYAFRCYKESQYKEISGILIKNDEYKGPISTDYLSSIKTYICKEGSCSLTDGYINYDTDKVYRISKYDYNYPIYSQDTCNRNNLSIAYYDKKFKICTRNIIYDKVLYKAKEINNETSSNYIITLEDSSTKNIYNLYISNKSGNVVARNVNSGYYLIDLNGDGKKILLKCYNERCYKNELEGYFINYGSKKSNSLILCKNGNCEITTRDNGYFLNSENEIIKCTSSKCEIEVNSNSCDGNMYKVIYSSGFKFCKDNSTDYISVNSINNKYYPVSVTASTSIFPKYDNGTDTILLAFNRYSVTQKITDLKGIAVSFENVEDVDRNNSGSTIYICISKSSACIVKPNTCDPKTSTGGCEGFYLDSGVLYQCRRNHYRTNDIYCIVKPASIRGYFLVTDHYHNKDVQIIKCDGNSCVKMDLPPEPWNDDDDDDYDEHVFIDDYDDKYLCNKDNVGELIYFNRKSYIGVCLNSKYSYTFGYYSRAYKRVIIELDTQNNIFAKSASEKYAMVEVAYDYIMLADLSEVESNTYMVNDKAYSFQNDGNGNVVINAIISTQVMAFRYKNEGTHMDELKYIMITEEEFQTDLSEDLSNISLYECHHTKECRTISGYLKHNSGNSTNIKISKCSEGSCNSSVMANVRVNICSSSTLGSAYYNIEKSQFRICVNTEKEGYKERIIHNDMVNHILYYNGEISSYTPYYTLYTSDIGGNIIGKAIHSGYYYLKPYNNFASFIECRNDNYGYLSCYKTIGNNGYYFNSGTLETSNIIHCINDTCEITPYNNGFFLNNRQNEIMRCESGTCSLKTIDYKTSCKHHENELVKSYEGIKYCSNETPVSFKNEDQFYPLSNITVNNNVYPGRITSGKGTILIKIDEYSASQYITEGICIDEEHHRDSNCNFKSPTLYVCTDESTSCNYGPLSNEASGDGYSISDFEIFKDNGALSNIQINIFAFSIKTLIITLILTLIMN